MLISDAGGSSAASWSPPTVGPQALPPPPPPPPPPAPTYSDQQATADAKQLWDATEGGLFGWGTDEDQIWKALEGKSADELAILNRAFKQNYGKDLDAVLRSELGDDEARRAESLLKANGSDADAVALHKALNEGSTDGVLDVVEGRDAKGRDDLANAYAQRYGEPADKADAKGYLLQQIQGPPAPAGGPPTVPRLFLSNEDQTRLTSLLAPQGGDAATGEAQACAARAKQAMDGWGTDEGALRDIFRGKTPEQAKAISSAYEAAYGDKLRDRLDDELDGTDQDEVFHLLDAPSSDQTAKAAWQADDDAIQLHKAVDGAGTDEDALRNTLQGKTPEQIQAINTAFEKRYGTDLKSRLQDDLSGDDADGILHLLDTPAPNDPGRADWQIEQDAVELHRAVDGAGTDEASIRQILGMHSKGEIDAIATVYRDKYGADLRSDLTDDLDGRDEFELVDQLHDRGAIDLKADPATVIAEKNRRTRELQAFEGDTSGVGFAQQAFHGDFDFETDGERLDRTLDASEQALKNGDIETAARYAGFSEENIKTLVETKNQAGDTAATAAAITASVIVTVGTAGTAAPLTVAAMSALAAGASSGTAYAAVNSQAGATDVGRQVLIGAASGATGAVPIGRATSLGAGLVDDAALATTRNTALNTLRNRAGNEMIIGAQSGAADGAVRTSTESETWKGGFLDGLKQVGTNTVVSGGAGALVGLMLPVPRFAKSADNAAPSGSNTLRGVDSSVGDLRGLGGKSAGGAADPQKAWWETLNPQEQDFMRQSGEFTCGPACGAQLAEQLGVTGVTEASLIAKLGEGVTTGDKLAAALNESVPTIKFQGGALTIEPSRMNDQQLTGVIKALTNDGSRPFMALFQSAPNADGHWVLVKGVNAEGKISVLDPAGLTYEQSLAGFRKSWQYSCAVFKELGG